MNFQDIIPRDPGYIRPDASLLEAANKMRAFDLDILLVGDPDRLAGAVTDRDFTVRAVAKGLDPRTTKISEIMTRVVGHSTPFR